MKIKRCIANNCCTSLVYVIYRKAVRIQSSANLKTSYILFIVISYFSFVYCTIYEYIVYHIFYRICIVYQIQSSIYRLLRIFILEIAIKSRFNGRPGQLGFLVGPARNNFSFRSDLDPIIKFVFLRTSMRPRKLQFSLLCK